MTADLINSKMEFRKYFLAMYASASTASTGASSTRPAPSQLNRFFARFNDPTATTPSGPEAELEALFQLRAESFDTCPDPVKWWGARLGHFPLMSAFARDIFSIPGEFVYAFMRKWR
jgi:hypothetical protein